MNTPPAKADGFSDKLCGNPLAWRPKAGSRPRGCPVQHDLRRSHVTIEDAAAVAAMHPFREALGLDCAAIRTCLAGAARIDQHDRPTGTFSLEGRELDELGPRGVVDGTGQHPTLRTSQDANVSDRLKRPNLSASLSLALMCRPLTLAGWLCQVVALK